jgi:predicted ATPase
MVYLKGVKLEQKMDIKAYPFNIPLVENFTNLTFDTPVTFLVGENGSGSQLY